MMIQGPRLSDLSQPPITTFAAPLSSATSLVRLSTLFPPASAATLRSVLEDCILSVDLIGLISCDRLTACSWYVVPRFPIHPPCVLATLQHV